VNEGLLLLLSVVCVAKDVLWNWSGDGAATDQGKSQAQGECGGVHGECKVVWLKVLFKCDRGDGKRQKMNKETGVGASAR